MLRNVEIKAKVRDVNGIINRASELSRSTGEIIAQHDIFYNATCGRLKLRKFDDSSSTLVFYERPDTEGPKESKYSLCNLPQSSNDPEETSEKLHTILAQSIGVKGELKKKRHLFMVGQTRVHIDDVEDLGNFMELEVVLRPDQTLEQGLQIAKDLQIKLGVRDDDLISGAYLDHLMKTENIRV